MADTEVPQPETEGAALVDPAPRAGPAPMPGVESDPAGDSTQLLARLQLAAERSTDPLLVSLLEVAQAAHDEWSQRCGVAEARRSAHERAIRAATEAQRRLDVILDAARRLDTALVQESESAAAHVEVDPVREPGSTMGARDASAPPLDLEARLLGPTQVYVRGTAVDQPGGKLQTLLAYLIANRHRAVARDVLVDLLWPDADVTAGRRNLHQLVYSLRRLLRSTRETDRSVVVHEHDHYRLNPELRIWVDIDEFDRLVTQGRADEAAGASDAAIDGFLRAEYLYRGDLLEDLPYEDWPSAERARLRTTYIEVGDRLGELLLEADRVDEAIMVSQRLLSRDEGHEAAHRRIMRAYLRRGDRGMAVRQYRSCVAVMEREYGLAPSAETSDLYRLATADAEPGAIGDSSPRPSSEDGAALS